MTYPDAYTVLMKIRSAMKNRISELDPYDDASRIAEDRAVITALSIGMAAIKRQDITDQLLTAAISEAKKQKDLKEKIESLNEKIKLQLSKR